MIFSGVYMFVSAASLSGMRLRYAASYWKPKSIINRWAGLILCAMLWAWVGPDGWS